MPSVANLQETPMRLVALALALALSLALPALHPAAAAEELTGTLKKVKELGAITMGVRDSSVPFSYLDDKQKPVGFAVDICMKVVDAVKARVGAPDLKVVITSVTGSTRIPLLANGTIDLECGSTTNNAARQKQVAFSNTYFLTASRFVSKGAAGFNGIDSLEGKTVASASGTINIAQLTNVNLTWKLGINILTAREHAEAFLLVETGRAVACVMDDVLLASFIAASKDPAAYKISEDAFSQPEPYSIMFRKDDPAFKQLVDAATADLFRSPEITAMYNRWFMQPIPPRNLNMNLPMSPELARAFQNPTDSPDPDHYGS
jgi:glutamate/aspartate transport system substrate-binding protein